MASRSDTNEYNSEGEEESSEPHFSKKQVTSNLPILPPGGVLIQSRPSDDFPAFISIARHRHREGTDKHGLREIVKDPDDIIEENLTDDAAHWYATLLKKSGENISGTVLEKADRYAEQFGDPECEYYRTGNPPTEIVYAPCMTNNANQGARWLHRLRKYHKHGKNAGIEDKHGELESALQNKNQGEDDAEREETKTATEKPLNLKEGTQQANTIEQSSPTSVRRTLNLGQPKDDSKPDAGTDEHTNSKVARLEAMSQAELQTEVEMMRDAFNDAQDKWLNISARNGDLAAATDKMEDARNNLQAALQIQEERNQRNGREQDSIGTNGGSPTAGRRVGNGMDSTKQAGGMQGNGTNASKAGKRSMEAKSQTQEDKEAAKNNIPDETNKHPEDVPRKRSWGEAFAQWQELCTDSISKFANWPGWAE